MPDPDTICGYPLSQVRRALREAIDRRDRRTAARWTAELIATPGAVGSLWAAYWLAWASAQGAGSASPTLPILLKQTWATAETAAYEHVGSPAGDGWPGFRNDPKVRALAAEMTMRLLSQPRQTPVVWPSKEITLYDVSVMQESAPPPESDGPVVLRVWRRDEDHMELRMMAGRWIRALQEGELRQALSAITWTLLPAAQQRLTVPLKCAERGPAGLPPKARGSPLWFWLELGRALLLSRVGIHRGWTTMHSATVEAFKLHYKRWTATDRMRILLAWILQVRASFQTQPETLWVAPALTQTATEIDLPYKEVAAELADPDAPIVRRDKVAAAATEKDDKKAVAARAEAKMAEAEAAVLAAMGLTEDDI